MYGKKLIVAMAVLVFVLCTSIALGKRFNAPVTDDERSENLIFGTVKQESIFLAQNDKIAPDDSSDKKKTISGSEIKRVEPESGPAADDKNKSSNAKSKPLKPFVPSEKIPGEQAVDFPVDI